MITLQHLVIYERYGGDDHGLAHIGTDEEKVLMSSGNWSLIQKLLQDITLVNCGLCSDEYAVRVEQALKYVCADEAIISRLRNLAAKSISK